MILLNTKLFSKMRLGVYINTPLYKDNNKGEYVCARPSLHEFFISFAKDLEFVSLISPVSNTLPKYPVVELPLPENVEVIPLPFTDNHINTLLCSWRIVPAVLKIAKRFFPKWDVLGCVVPSLVGSVIFQEAQRRGKPVFFYVRGDIVRIFERKYQKGLKRVFFKAIVKSLDYFTQRAIGSGTPMFVCGTHLLRRYGGNSKPVYLIAPLLSDQFLLAKQSFGSIMHSEHEFRILYVGWLYREKGLFDLIDAMSILVNETLGNSTLILVGRGSEKVELQRYVKNLGIDSIVHFVGPLARGEKLFAKYAKASVLVLPSYTEGTPRVIAEAMAMGLPVVATRVGGIPDMILENESGLLVPPGSPSDLANALNRLRQDTMARKKMGMVAEALSHKYTFESQRKQLLTNLQHHLHPHAQRAHK